MKHSDISNVTSLLESTENSQSKLKSIQSLIKQICSPDSIDWEEASQKFKDKIVYKKIPNFAPPEPTNPMQKTVKIKKNKRKQKKKPVASLTQPSNANIKQKQFPQEICTCCSGKLECTPTQDGYESQEQDYYGSDSHIESIIESIGQQLLECFYDEIDRAVVRIMKDAESQHSRTFIRLMRKLADIFQDFDQDFREQIEKQLEGQTLSPMQTGWTVCQQFKMYIITRFPLLKDFIENFKMGQLDEKQAEQFAKLQYRSPLIQSIYIHMQEISAKKEKKRNKRQLQKLNKKSKEGSRTFSGGIQEELVGSDLEIIQRLRNLKIKDGDRTQCFFDYENFNKRQKQLAKNDR